MTDPTLADPTAVFGRRVLAFLIDVALIVVPAMILVTSQIEYLEVNKLPVGAQEFCDRWIDEQGGMCLNFADLDDRVYFSDGVPTSGTTYLWAVNFGMLVLVQGFTGRTLGKALTGIRTVGEDGRPPGFLKALVRWLLWIVDGFPYVAPLVGFIVGLTTVGHRRVGDMVAKTFVVRSAAAGSPVAIPGPTAPAPPVGVGQTWGLPAPPASVPPAADRPHWDEARGTYIQWDPGEAAWMQWDDGQKTWSPIPGQ